MSMDDAALQKSATLLYTLGEEAAAEVLKHLEPREVQRIGTAMAALKVVTREKSAEVLTEFQSEAAQNASLGIGTDAFLRSVLTKALGTDKAPPVIDRIIKGQDTGGIEGLKWMDSASVAELVRNEHPQIIATIIAHLDRDQSAEILAYFTERIRNDVILRLATLDGIQPQALRDLNDILAKLLSGSDNIKKAALGGVRVVSEILNFMPGKIEESVIENVRDYDQDLAQRILDEMFLFDDLLDLENRSIQTIMRQVDQETIIIAIKAAKTELKEKFLGNMSARQAESVRDELITRPPIRLSDVEAAQKDILKIVRDLIESGEITIAKGGEDVYV